ncbi:SLATT domain-containing protein [Streptomyces virginiae]|uniref:SLATT domain-containing protein n=1 Tax=Streptomyces virginiae TaxID=1961 RepID=UPI0036532AF6
MMMTESQIDQARTELERIKGNCLYSAQAYFEAAKSAELWGRLMVFLPACVTAISGLLLALGIDRKYGAISATAGAIAATASFLGSTKKATDFLSSARSYTVLRHKVHSELSFLDEQSDFSATKEKAQELNSEYMRIAAADTPVPNRHFTKAVKRIEQGAAD